MRKCRNDYVLRDLYRVFLIFLLFYEQAKANITSQKIKQLTLRFFIRRLFKVVGGSLSYVKKKCDLRILKTLHSAINFHKLNKL